MLFLASFIVTEHTYMGGTSSYTSAQLVEANDVQDARDSLIDHYESLGDDYSISYAVEVLDIAPAIISPRLGK